MELLLNLGWIAISIAIGWFATRDGCSGRKRATVIITLALLSAVLFPAISMSDDLHVDFVLADEVSSRRHSTVHALSATVALLISVVLITLPRINVAFGVKNEGLISAVRAGFLTAVGLRAPPAVLV